MRILFVAESGDSACRDVRAEIPAEGLRLHGHDVDVCSLIFENADHKLYGWDHVAEKQLPCPRIVVVRHTDGPDGEVLDSVDMYRNARKHGQRIFYDLDDDLWNIPEWNPSSKWVTEQVQNVVVANVNACDGLIVSTDAIADSAQAHGIIVPIFVVHNGVRFPGVANGRWGENRPLRLAWFGSLAWREFDFAEVGTVLAEFLRERDDVQFWHVGWRPGEPQFHTEALPHVAYPWVPYTMLPNIMQMVDCAIVPMTEHPFNRARSNVFGLRLAANGVAFAASSTPEYERLFVEGAGYLVPNPDMWDHALHVLCDKEYAENRTQMRNTGLAVAKRHDEQSTGRRYADLFDG